MHGKIYRVVNQVVLCYEAVFPLMKYYEHRRAPISLLLYVYQVMRRPNKIKEVTHMNDIIKKIEAGQLKEKVDDFNVGDTVRVSALIKEGNRERIQVFEGTVLKRQGGGARETFTVRKTSNGVGVEKTWPLHSPFISSIQVVRKGKIRRAKLYYLRDRVGKSAKVKEAGR